MMKKIFIILVIAFISFPAFSQVRFGLKVAAATTTTPTYNPSTGTNNFEAVKNSDWGLQGGAFLRISLAGLYIEPELLFASNSYDYNVTTATVPQVLTQKFNRLSIPLLLGFKLGPLRLNAGPAASIQIGSPKSLTNDPNFDKLYKSAIFGYQAGIGIDLLKTLTLDARYAGSLGEKFGDSVTIGGQSYKLDYGQSSFILSVGLMF
jgi:hypothetical protein